MIKINELRIGNYFDSNGEIKKVTPNTIESLYESEDRIWVKPIPLTEKWLINLGFNKDYKKGWIGIDFGNTDFVLATPENLDNSTGKYTWFFNQGRVPMYRPLEYVHQLQNLFFALTSEELKISTQ